MAFKLHQDLCSNSAITQFKKDNMNIQEAIVHQFKKIKLPSLVPRLMTDDGDEIMASII